MNLYRAVFTLQVTLEHLPKCRTHLIGTLQCHLLSCKTRICTANSQGRTEMFPLNLN